MASLTSESHTTPEGVYESFTAGPGRGRFRMPPGGGGPGDFMEMFQAMYEEGLAGKKQKRREGAERHSEWKRSRRRERAPKLAADTSKTRLDPMRYARKHGLAARMGAESRPASVVGNYGQGRLAGAHAEGRAREEALGAYPMYQAMLV